MSSKDTDWEQQAQAFIAEHWPQPEALVQPGAYQRASEHWYRVLGEQGWSVAHWPQTLGGSSWPSARAYRWQMLCQQAQTPPINTLALAVIAPLLMAAAPSPVSPARQHSDVLLSEIACFDAHWCLGLLEPITARAEELTRVSASSQGFVLNGSKRALGDGLLGPAEQTGNGLWPRRILCLAMDAQSQWRACVVPADRAGVTLAAVPNQQGRWFHVAFDEVALAAEELLPLAGEELLSALAGTADQRSVVLPSASSHALGVQLELLKRELLANPHEDTDALLSQLHEAEIALAGLRALETRALAPVSPQFPQALPVAMLNVKSQELEQQIGSLQLASFGYYALPSSDGLRDHNQSPINPGGDSAGLVGQALSALASSAYGWNPRDILAKHWLQLDDEKS